MSNRSEKLTLRLLKSLVGSSDRVYDTEVPGLQAHAGKRCVSFYVRKFFNGKAWNKTIGRFPAMTLDEARAEALKFIASLENYEIPDAVVKGIQPTVGEAIDWYMDHLHSPSRSYFNVWSHLRKKKIAELKKSDIIAVRDAMRNTPTMSNICVRYLGTAIHAFSDYLEIDLPNPAYGMKKYHTEPRRRFLSDEEAPRLLKELQQMTHEGLYAVQAEALLGMIYTGARKSNVLQMNLSEIRDGIWTVPFTKSKNSRDLIIPLNEYALEIVERRKAFAIDGYLFCRGGKPLKDVRKTMYTACDRAGIKDCHVHDLRRTLGSWMLMNGTPIEVVSRTLGHSSIRVTESVYAHLLPKKISTATSAAVDAMFKGKV